MNQKYEKLISLLENALEDTKNTLEYMEDAQVQVSVFHMEDQKELYDFLQSKTQFFSSTMFSLKRIISEIKGGIKNDT